MLAINGKTCLACRSLGLGRSPLSRPLRLRHRVLTRATAESTEAESTAAAPAAQEKKVAAPAAPAAEEKKVAAPAAEEKKVAAPAAAEKKAAAPAAEEKKVAAPAAEEKKERKASPLARGGTKEDLSKPAESGAGKKVLQLTADGKFEDWRWEGGRWNLALFQNAEGKMDWDSWNKVMDAEMARRKLLEDSPIPSTNEDPVVFDTAEIPWWAWVARFHLPEAEKLNGRACMVGYAAAWVVDSLSGAGLVDQQNSFLGKLLLHVVVFGVLLVRNQDSLPTFKGLIDEATFYDKQWAASWQGKERPSETES